MDLKTYHQYIDTLWQNIENQLEHQDCDADCEIHGAVFEIFFPNNQQIVINKQEPLLELWLASRAGGYHFHFENNEWVTQTGEKFWDLLETACKTCGEQVSFLR